MSFTGLERAIILSISYSSIFSHPLSCPEIWLRLVIRKPVFYKKVREALSELVSKKIIITDGQYYTLSDSTFFSIRKKRHQLSLSKRSEATLFVKKARLIPFVKALIITGSVSVNNAKENDDIDWLIITQKHTLWIVRPLVILLATFFGKRRERNGNHRDNSWCFNMFLSEDCLQVADKNKNIYTAYEVFQADFVYDQNNIESKFLGENSWVKKYLPNYWLEKNKKIDLIESSNCKKISNKDLSFFSIINKLLFFIQYQYMKKAITREVVQINKALFHPRNTHGEVLKKWKEIVRDV
ncbi:MAG: hypothetical protein GW942_02435 [Candidatus Pacebacteria bacterium]|nr:hypothetical protein [Candidatus Paceibacterota bacterium]